MDDINDFFNFGKDSKFKRETISNGYVGGRRLDTSVRTVPVKREVVGSEYGEKYRKEEDEQILRVRTFNICY